MKSLKKFTPKRYRPEVFRHNGKVQSLEKEKIGVIKITEPTWALEICRKLLDLEEKSRRNNFRILGIKEDSRESQEEFENKIYDLLEEKLDMDTSNITIERAHRVGEKSKDQERELVVQFLFYKDKINVLRNCKIFRELKFSYSKDFPKR